jgi:hypothetical protein
MAAGEDISALLYFPYQVYDSTEALSTTFSSEFGKKFARYYKLMNNLDNWVLFL